MSKEKCLQLYQRLDMNTWFRRSDIKRKAATKYTDMCSFCVWPASAGLSLSEGDAVNTWVASWGWEEGAGGSWEVLGASSCSLVLSFNESQCCHQRELSFYFIFLRTWKTTQQQETYYSVITVAVSVLLTRYIYTQNHFKMMPSNYQIFIFSVFCPI